MKITKKQLQEMIRNEAKKQLQENKSLFGKWQPLIDKFHEQGMSDEAILHDLLTSVPEKELKLALKNVARMNAVDYP